MPSPLRRVPTVTWPALAALLLAACADTAAPDSDHGEIAIQALQAPPGAARVYIVQLAESVDVDATLDDVAALHGLGVVHRYRHALRGGALLMAEPALKALAQDPRIVRIEPDQPLQAIADAGIQAQTAPTGYRLIGADVTANEGAGQRVAVLDTGIDLDHPDLKANVETTYAKDCLKEGGGKHNDGNGHGSHVAGTIAAVDNATGVVGVGSAIRVVPVKVLNRRGSGSWSSVICGIDHVTANKAVLRVANLSLGGAGTECSGSGCTKSSLQLAIEKSVAAGVTYAVAAGNDGKDAAGFVPAAYDAVITVSAYSDGNGELGAGDGWPSWTNYGSDVDIAAPGAGIFSTYKDAQYATLSGTSMAAPHVAAACALYLAANPTATPAQVRDGLRGLATASYPGCCGGKHVEPLLDVRGL